MLLDKQRLEEFIFSESFLRNLSGGCVHQNEIACEKKKGGGNQRQGIRVSIRERELGEFSDDPETHSNVTLK